MQFEDLRTLAERTQCCETDDCAASRVCRAFASLLDALENPSDDTLNAVCRAFVMHQTGAVNQIPNDHGRESARAALADLLESVSNELAP